LGLLASCGKTENCVNPEVFLLTLPFFLSIGVFVNLKEKNENNL